MQQEVVQGTAQLPARQPHAAAKQLGSTQQATTCVSVSRVTARAARDE